MNQHTHGPWTIETNAGHPHIEIWTNNGRPQRIAYMQDHLSESDANARLIATAPDLLEALKDVLPFAQRYCTQNGINAELHLKLANDAIAKVEGRERP